MLSTKSRTLILSSLVVAEELETILSQRDGELRELWTQLKEASLGPVACAVEAPRSHVLLQVSGLNLSQTDKGSASQAQAGRARTASNGERF